MLCLLTSSPFLEDESALNPANGLADALLGALPDRPVRGLAVASSPDAPAINDDYAPLQRAAFEASGISFSDYTVLDRRNADRAAALVASADMILLSGGHVPTQNRFFHDIGLRALLARFDGVVIGFSAGTMNAAETVYAQPELEGEAVDPAYRRFLPGLGLTRTMVIPHFDGDLDIRLDGLRVYDEITFPDSIGRRFYALPDGSYLRIDGAGEALCGKAFLIEGGGIRPFCGDGECVRL